MDGDLKGLSKAQLRDVARKLNIAVYSRTTARELKQKIGSSVTSAAMAGGRVASSEGLYRNVDPAKVAEARNTSRSRQIERVNAAVSEVRKAGGGKSVPAKKASGSRSRKPTAGDKIISGMNQGSRDLDRMKADMGRGKLDHLKVGPGQPVGTLTPKQQGRLVKDYGLGGALAGSRMPTYDPVTGKVTPSAHDRFSSRPMPSFDHLGKLHQPTTGERLPAAYNKVNTPLAVASFGIHAGRSFSNAKRQGKSTGEAAKIAAIEATPMAAVIAAPAIAKGANVAAGGLFATSKALMEVSSDMLVAEAMTGFWTAKLGLGAGAAGMAMKGVEYAAKGLSKFALPAAVAMGAGIGAKNDKNRLRGAVRGTLSAFDPTAIFMEKGIAQKGFDAVFGGPDTGDTRTPAPKRLSQGQERQFSRASQTSSRATAMTNHDAMGMTDPGVHAGGRGFANPAVQKAAQAAKGREWSGRTKS